MKDALSTSLPSCPDSLSVAEFRDRTGATITKISLLTGIGERTLWRYLNLETEQYQAESKHLAVLWWKLEIERISTASQLIDLIALEAGSFEKIEIKSKLAKEVLDSILTLEEREPSLSSSSFDTQVLILTYNFCCNHKKGKKSTASIRKAKFLRESCFYSYLENLLRSGVKLRFKSDRKLFQIIDDPQLSSLIKKLEE